jgi:hypothetical protein
MFDELFEHRVRKTEQRMRARGLPKDYNARESLRRIRLAEVIRQRKAEARKARQSDTARARAKLVEARAAARLERMTPRQIRALEQTVAWVRKAIIEPARLGLPRAEISRALGVRDDHTRATLDEWELTWDLADAQTARQARESLRVGAVSPGSNRSGPPRRNAPPKGRAPPKGAPSRGGKSKADRSR